MKILHVINHYHENFGYQENFLAVNQKKLGHETLIVTSDYYFPFPDYEKSVGNILGKRKVGDGEFFDKNIKIIRKKSLFQSLKSPNFVWFSLRKELFKFKPDIIHVHNPFNLFLFEIFFFQKKIGYKIFIDSHHDHMVENKKYSFLKNIYYFCWNTLYNFFDLKKRVSKFLPTTVSAAKWLKEKVNIVDNYIEISELGVDLDSMSYNSKLESDFRKKYNLEKKMIMINAGKQYTEKKIHEVIKIVIDAKKINKNAFLILVGLASDEYEYEISKLLSKLGESNYLRFPFLNRKELNEVYCAADIGIWPGIPSNTIQEAMASKVAVILPQNDIVGHLIDGNGIYFDEKKLHITQFLKECSFSQNQLEKYKLKSQEIAIKYSWSNIVKDLDQIYKDNS